MSLDATILDHNVIYLQDIAWYKKIKNEYILNIDFIQMLNLGEYKRPYHKDKHLNAHLFENVLVNVESALH